MDHQKNKILLDKALWRACEAGGNAASFQNPAHISVILLVLKMMKLMLVIGNIFFSSHQKSQKKEKGNVVATKSNFFSVCWQKTTMLTSGRFIWPIMFSLLVYSLWFLPYLFKHELLNNVRESVSWLAWLPYCLWMWVLLKLRNEGIKEGLWFVEIVWLYNTKYLLHNGSLCHTKLLYLISTIASIYDLLKLEKTSMNLFSLQGIVKPPIGWSKPNSSSALLSKSWNTGLFR